MASEVSVAWEGGEVSGRLAGEGEPAVLLAHGAGTDQEHPFMVALRDRLAARSMSVMTFNYPYSERGAKRPDRMERLMACHRAAAERLAADHSEVVLAGRSMGGRVATHLAADGHPCLGVALYSYPLHPAGKPDRLRTEHLSAVDVPMIFFVGDRDALSRMDLFREHISTLPGAEVVIMEGAGHSTRGGGWTPESMADHLAEGTASWLARLRSGEAAAGQA